MKTITILALALVLPLFSMAQQGSKVAHTIKGKVVNAATNESVAYTNIGLEDTFYGTASDSEGNFELKIPEELVSKDIYFSAVGFVNKKFPVSSLFDKEFNVIKLEAQSYGIEDVDVAAQNLVLIRILRMASENIRYNFGSGPFNLHCDYSNDITINDTTTKKVTANVLIYDRTGYSQPSKINAFQARNYSVKNTEGNDDYRFASGSVNLDEMLEFDWVRAASNVLNPGLLNDYSLKLESEPTVNGEDCWVISFSQKNPTPESSGDFYASEFKGRITVNKEDYSVLKIEGEVKSPKHNRQGKGLAIGAITHDFLENVSYSYEVEYKNLLINKIAVDKSYTFKNDKIRENTVLQVHRAHANNLTVLENRDYFTGE